MVASVGGAPPREGYGHEPSGVVSHLPDLQNAGPTFPLTDAQPVPVVAPPSPLCVGVPASHVFGQESEYWHQVPSASEHEAPFVG